MIFGFRNGRDNDFAKSAESSDTHKSPIGVRLFGRLATRQKPVVRLGTLTARERLHAHVRARAGARARASKRVLRIHALTPPGVIGRTEHRVPDPIRDPSA